MYSDHSDHAQSQSSLVVRGMGWLALFGAVSHLPLIIAGVSVMRVMPGAGWALILFAVPATCLLLMGGMGLVMHKGFGFYLVYAAILFGGIGGLGISLIPGLKALLKGNFYAEDIVLVTNLALLGLLVYCHFQSMDTPAPRIHVAAISILVVLGLAHIGIVRANFDRQRGTVQNMASVPYAGGLFNALETTGPIYYRLQHSKWQADLTSVISGKTSEENLAAIVRENNLKEVPVERLGQFLVLARDWKLSPQIFVTLFTTNDLCYIGRFATHPRLTLQIGLRKSDGRFTAQTMGFLRSSDTVNTRE